MTRIRRALEGGSGSSVEMLSDYYSMLGVDPRADRTELQSALARRQAQWSSGTRNPKTRHQFQSYLEQIPALRQALLSEQSARAQYDARLAAIKRGERDRQRAELERLVRLKTARGGLSPSDRAQLIDRAERLDLTAFDVDEMVRGVPVWPDPPADPDADEATDEVLSASVRQQLRLVLQSIGRSDLYDALGVSRDARVAEIAARADAERQRWMQKSQVTAEKTAWLEVVTYAQAHLLGPATRRRYDQTLKLEVEEAFQELVAFAIRKRAELDDKTRSILEEEARAQGITPERTERLLRRTCKRSGVEWARREPMTNGQAHRNGVPAPPAPRTGPDPILDRLKEQAQHAFKTRDYSKALDALVQIEAKEPFNDAARKAVRTVKQRLEQIERAEDAYRQDLARTHLIAARKSLQIWAGLVEPLNAEVESQRAELNTRIRQALALAARGRALLPGDVSAAVDVFRQALAIASDLPEALDGLRLCPPQPPRNLTAELRGGKVLLRWSAPPPDDFGPVEFRVVRKRNATPENPFDGVVVALTTNAEAEDADPPGGESLGYAVFAQRGETASTAEATIGPVLVLPDVRDLASETVTAGEVHLTWTLPAGAIGVRVVRKDDGQPSGPGDGDVIPTLKDRAVDRGLAEDKIYQYGVFALYSGPPNTGRLRASRGVFVAVWPTAAPGLGGPLNAVSQPDGRVRLSWTPPNKGTTRIIRTDRPIARALLAHGCLSAAEAQSLPGTWLHSAGANAAFDAEPPLAGIFHYTAFVGYAGLWRVGPEVAFSRMRDPSELKIARVGASARVHLRWKWGTPDSQTLLVWKPGAPPSGPEDPGARSALVSELDFLRQGFHTIDLPQRSHQSWSFRAYSVLSVNGERFLSPGTDPTSRVDLPPAFEEIEVSYRLRRPILGKTWKVEFQTQPAGAAIPPTTLVGHPRTVPIAPDDGEVLDRFPAAADGAVFPVRSRKALAAYKTRIFLDPTTHLDELAPIRLRHPPESQARL